MQTSAFSSAVDRVMQAPMADVLEIASELEARARARLAVFCYARTHLRAKGLAITSICQPSELRAESTVQATQTLLEQARTARALDVIQHQQRFVSLRVGDGLGAGGHDVF